MDKTDKRDKTSKVLMLKEKSGEVLSQLTCDKTSGPLTKPI